MRGTLLNTRAADNDVTIQPDGRTEKYRGETTRDNPAYIIRFAEMYLIRAEAKGRSMGLNDLNIIRNKRGIASLTAGNTATDDAFINAVLNERRAEFNFEGHRFFDLARTDKATSVLGVAAFRKILPIPGREVSAAGLKQNPQY